MRPGKLTLSDLNQARELWSLCFPEDSEAFVDWFFANQFPVLSNWSVWEKDRLRAAVYAMPYTLTCRGNNIPAALLLGVATHPETRRRGLMRGLLHEVHTDLAESCAAVCLHPSDHSFYHKLGYSTVADHLRAHLPLSALHPFEPCGAIEPDPDFDRLATINQQHSEHMEFYAIRDRGLLARRFADLQTGGGFCIANEQAYAFVDPESERADRSGIYYLPEFSYADITAGFSLLIALRDSASGVRAFEFSLPITDANAWLSPQNAQHPTPNTQHPTPILTREPFLMLYGLNWPAIVSGMRADTQPATASPSKVIHILGEDANWRITAANGTASMSAVQTPSDITLSRDQFTRWICGYNDGGDSVSESAANAMCPSFFPTLSAYFFDRY
ncbi:MAG: GNAT family N-acetyltransferase [Peptococcaceae bacterium]|nr:GNAT family N-acetyltransferase [Peptococcaceae bacterium]